MGVRKWPNVDLTGNNGCDGQTDQHHDKHRASFMRKTWEHNTSTQGYLWIGLPMWSSKTVARQL